MHHALTPLLLFATLCCAACVPLSQFDEMESSMLSRVDSLEIQLAECRTQSTLLLDRLAAIERENLQLDDRNRLLAARLAELQYRDTDQESVTTTPASYDDASRRDALHARTPAFTPVADTGDEAAGQQQQTTPLASDRDPASSSGVGEQTDAPGLESEAPPGAAEQAPLHVAAPRSFNPAVAPDLEYLRRYQEALRMHQSGEHERAYQAFEALLSQSTPNDMADNCLYWMARCEMEAGRNAQALPLLTSALACTPSDKTAEALLARARVLYALGRAADATADVQRLNREYPASREARDAAALPGGKR
jgi:TolA-binding protein